MRYCKEVDSITLNTAVPGTIFERGDCLFMATEKTFLDSYSGPAKLEVLCVLIAKQSNSIDGKIGSFARIEGTAMITPRNPKVLIVT